MSTAASTGAAAAAAARLNAISACGVIIRVEPSEFSKFISSQSDSVVVIAPGGFWNSGLNYLTSYKGLAFTAYSRTPLAIPPGTTIVEAKRIWLPG